MGYGIFSFLRNGDLIGGLWFVFIGWFLEHSARASYDQVLLQEMMSPLTAREAMSPEPETVPPDLPIDDLVHDYFLRRPYNSFPVTEDGIVLGIVTLSQVKHLAKEEWKEKRVSDVMSSLDETVLVEPETPMTAVLEKMRVTATGRVLVAREWELLGIISSTDIARWLDRVSLIDCPAPRIDGGTLDGSKEEPSHTSPLCRLGGAPIQCSSSHRLTRLMHSGDRDFGGSDRREQRRRSDRPLSESTCSWPAG
jgi:CBS domain-containing protein